MTKPTAAIAAQYAHDHAIEAAKRMIRLRAKLAQKAAQR